MKLTTALNILLFMTTSSADDAMQGHGFNVASQGVQSNRNLLSAGKEINGKLVRYKYPESLPKLVTYDDARNFCLSKGQTVPSEREICPDWKPAGGSPGWHDIWVIIGNSSNDWVNIGGNYLCKTHITNYGPPKRTSWHTAYNQYLYCKITPTAKPTLEPTSNPTSAPTPVIQGAYGDGCRNSVDFTSSFVTESGEACTSCQFCGGSKLRDIFYPKKESMCIDCQTSDNKCNGFQAMTNFQQAWEMKFVSIRSSSMDSNLDPKSVLIQGSEDGVNWSELFNSDDNTKPLFKERNESVELLFADNNKSYNNYKVTFMLPVNESKMYLDLYSVVEAYTKTCTVNNFNDITGSNVLAYKTF